MQKQMRYNLVNSKYDIVLNQKYISHILTSYKKLVVERKVGDKRCQTF